LGSKGKKCFDLSLFANTFIYYVQEKLMLDLKLTILARFEANKTDYVSFKTVLEKWGKREIT